MGESDDKNPHNIKINIDGLDINLDTTNHFFHISKVLYLFSPVFNFGPQKHACLVFR